MDDTLLVAVLVAGLVWYAVNQGNSADPQDENLLDTAMTTIDEATATPGPVQDYSTSQAMLSMLMRREAYAPTPYQLGDGGWTVGYGHYEKNRANLPDCSTQGLAAAVFANDVINRGEKWVKLYVTVDLTQNEFDALVSIAYNMSPQSFKKFAASVNAGNGIDQIAQDSVRWVNAKFTNGIQNRRNAELDVYNNGVYA